MRAPSANKYKPIGDPNGAAGCTGNAEAEVDEDLTQAPPTASAPRYGSASRYARASTTDDIEPLQPAASAPGVRSGSIAGVLRLVNDRPNPKAVNGGAAAGDAAGPVLPQASVGEGQDCACGTAADSDATAMPDTATAAPLPDTLQPGQPGDVEMQSRHTAATAGERPKSAPRQASGSQQLGTQSTLGRLVGNAGANQQQRPPKEPKSPAWMRKRALPKRPQQSTIKTYARKRQAHSSPDISHAETAVPAARALLPDLEPAAAASVAPIFPSTVAVAAVGIGAGSTASAYEHVATSSSSAAAGNKRKLPPGFISNRDRRGSPAAAAAAQSEGKPAGQALLASAVDGVHGGGVSKPCVQAAKHGNNAASVHRTTANARQDGRAVACPAFDADLDADMPAQPAQRRQAPFKYSNRNNDVGATVKAAVVDDSAAAPTPSGRRSEQPVGAAPSTTCVKAEPEDGGGLGPQHFVSPLPAAGPSARAAVPATAPLIAAAGTGTVPAAKAALPGTKLPSARMVEAGGASAVGNAVAPSAPAAPAPMQPGGYKYSEVVRRKEDRALLNGFDCPSCKAFYEAVESWGGAFPTGAAPSCGHQIAGKGGGGGGGPQALVPLENVNVNQLRQDVSRHR